MEVPWFELYMDEKEQDALVKTFQSKWIGIGPRVKEFEEKVAGYIGVRNAVAVSSGTAALDIALKLLNIEYNDEVIVPGMAYIATVNSVLFQKAIPVFADIDPNHFGIDPFSVEELITEKTKCIIPINYAGHSIDWEKLRDLTDKKGIKIIEDGAASFGGEYKEKKLCSLGDISITSFHVAKTFTTIEGGMIFTNDDEYARKAKMIRSHGEDPNKKYWHPILGHNYRMTDINASIGLVQFSRINDLLEKRAEAANYYSELLKGIKGVKSPSVNEGCKHSWFIYPVLIDNRDSVKKILEDNGVGTNVSWPYPAYEQLHLKKFKKDILPVTEKITSTIIGLPMFYKIAKKQQQYVVEKLEYAINKI